MKTRVVVLCQGQQSRLPDLEEPKQLLNLLTPPTDYDAEHCVAMSEMRKGPPILTRTLRQALHLASSHRSRARVDVVSWPSIGEYYRFGVGKHPVWSDLNFVSLFAPGNSSLRGLQRYFASRPIDHEIEERVIVLLGDVIYSWKCLEALFDPKRMVTFATTSDLSPSSGELWGVSWDLDNVHVLELLFRAKHPPAQVDGTYQCGQLRQWWWAYRETLEGRNEPSPLVIVDDYTMDVDTPIDLVKIPAASIAAYEDDLAHGMVWG